MKKITNPKMKTVTLMYILMGFLYTFILGYASAEKISEIPQQYQEQVKNINKYSFIIFIFVTSIQVFLVSLFYNFLGHLKNKKLRFLFTYKLILTAETINIAVNIINEILAYAIKINENQKFLLYNFNPLQIFIYVYIYEILIKHFEYKKKNAIIMSMAMAVISVFYRVMITRGF